MIILVVGHSAREHAIVRRLIAEGHTVIACAAKQNQGLISDASSFERVSGYTSRDIVRLARSHGADVILPCNEQVLYAGIKNAAARAKIPCLGHPREVATHLELNRPSVIASLKPRYPAKPPIGLMADDPEYVQGMLKSFKGQYDRFVVKPLQSAGAPRRPAQIVGMGDKADQKNFPAWVEPYIPGQEFTFHYAVSKSRLHYLGITRDFPQQLGPDGSQIEPAGMASVAMPEDYQPYLTINELNACHSMVDNGLKSFAKGMRAKMLGFISVRFNKTADALVFSEMNCKPGNPELPALLQTFDFKFGDLIKALLHDKAFKVRQRRSAIAMSLAPVGYPAAARQRHEVPSTLLDRQDVYFGETLGSKDTLCSGKSRTLCVVESTKSLAAGFKKAHQAAADIHAQTGLVYLTSLGVGLSKEDTSRRVKRSLITLHQKGGKRIMLRVSPSAYESLKAFMVREGIKTETAAINLILERASMRAAPARRKARPKAARKK